MSRSAEELERQAEQVRAQMAGTAERIRGRLTPGQMVDEAFDYFRDSDSSLAVHNLKNQVRDNPLALAMMGAGMAWLMSGVGSPSLHRHRSNGSGHAHTYRTGMGSDGNGSYAGPNSYPDADSAGGSNGGLSAAAHQAASALGGAASSAGSAAGRAKAGITGAASSFRDATGRASSGMAGAASHASHGIRDTGAYVRDEAGAMSGYTRRMFSDAMNREPLILGAIGLAIGAAVGAMLPSTRYEDEHFGEARDNLKESASESLAKGAEAAKDVAAETYRAAKDEARNQGLVAEDDKPLASRMAKVAETASETAKEAAERKTGSSASSTESTATAGSRTTGSSTTSSTSKTPASSKTSGTAP